MVVGLGNPGERYRSTRHNFGFMCIDGIVEKYGLDTRKSKFSAEIFCGSIENYDVMAVKPKTFMNNSGVAVRQLKLFYKIPEENIFVFHDDLDLELCRVKLKVGGSDGGHNGIKSIDAMIGRNYSRIRLGIGRPKEKSEIINFVTEDFTLEEIVKVKNTVVRIGSAVGELFTRRENFINRLLNN
ncbi:MAG: aminoacyl-tRNA hydrolase [Rickettsiales bacterium]|jgi:PTH1 family peptidyl-tRNA hydrolase|nr:aminoacyl-tRNA hydrolase [Rickettsiales bacterium]